MLKEYKTISEVTGPLMLVKGVEGVGYDELGEIELPNGDIRHCRVLESQRRQRARAAVREAPPASTWQHSKVRFLGHGTELAVSPRYAGTRLRRHGTRRIDGGPAIIPG